MVDANGQTVFANQALADLLGDTVERVMETSLLDWLPPAEQQRLAEREGGMDAEEDWTYIRADGSTFVARLRSGPCTLPDGSQGALAVLEDVTELRQAQAEAEAHRDRLRVALTLGRMAIWEWSDGQVHWSGALERIFGIAPEDFPTNDDDYFARVHPDDRAQLATTYWRMLAGRSETRDVRFYYRIVRPDGGVRWIEATGELEADAEGTPIRGFGTCFDVTDRTRLQRASTQVQRQDVALKLAAVSAHEVNNLLTAIRASAEFAREISAEEDVEWREDCELIVEATDRAAALSNSLVEVARRSRSSPAPLDISAKLRSSKRLLGALCRPHAQVSLRCDEPVVVRMDGGDLHQVVVNLLLNAAQACGSDGHIEVSTEVRVLREAIGQRPPGLWAIVTVRDDGPGMDAATVEKIWDPFFTTREDGTGMGLVAIRSIVDGLGGTVLVDSSPGGGTAFHVWLPAHAAEDVSHPFRPARVPRRADGGPRVLLVEPEELSRSAVARRLAKLGYEVQTATDGLEGMAALQDGVVDAIITERDMPRMGGVEVCRRLHRFHPEVPVVLTTSEPLVDEDLGSRVIVLTKPFDTQQLHASIQLLLSGTE